MPPKQKYEKQDILQVAFQLVKEEGLSKLTARNIANKLGSSTAPIYSYYDNITVIKHEVIQKAKEKLLEMARKEYTPDSFLNIGIGQLVFARDYSALYKDLLMGSDDFLPIIDDLNKEYLIQMKKNNYMHLLDDKTIEEILEKMSLYTHGLGIMLIAGRLSDTSIDFFIEKLKNMGKDIICFAMISKGIITSLDDPNIRSYKKGECNNDYNNTKRNS